MAALDEGCRYITACRTKVQAGFF
ncbi:hypothetical protein B14911_05119 [Bacillus sp. NRRL B-14911]|nr:hypothetical protein B14911_05119 [Bacillus sp. NRRL B-14911]